jgi:small subunit ribosomal protein S17
MPKVTKLGVVTSNKMAKTVVVSVQRLVRHPMYRRAFKKTSTFLAHDEGNRCQIGDRVRIEECRPLSRHKRWRVVAVLGREFVPEPLPEELDQAETV